MSDLKSILGGISIVKSTGVLSKYKKLSIKIFNSKYRGFAVLFSGSIFSFLFNLRAILRGKKIRFNFDKSSNLYYLIKPLQFESRTRMVYFKEKFHNYNNYQNGVEQRALLIGADYMLDQIQFKSNDLIVDCGANVGDLLLYFELKKLNINNVGIEASHDTFECLKMNAKNRTLYNFALADKNEIIDFFISEKNADSSIIEPLTVDKVVKLQSTRLDTLIDSQIKLLKVEAEGAEIEVLHGAINLLSRIEYISVDAGFERGRNLESTLVPVTNFLMINNFILLDFNFPRMVLLFKNSKFSQSLND
jgi:FkbM family methyltransferase